MFFVALMVSRLDGVEPECCDGQALEMMLRRKAVVESRGKVRAKACANSARSFGDGSRKVDEQFLRGPVDGFQSRKRWANSRVSGTEADAEGVLTL